MRVLFIQKLLQGGACMRRMGKKLKNNEFLKGAAIIAAGGFIAKIIGALYRIPLTNLIGGHGLGLYQMVYPVYCLLLTVSATGIPSSIAKLTAERIGRGESPTPLFKKSMRLFLLIGLVGSVLMAAFAPLLSASQDAREILGGYFALAPAVFFVSAISVFRGYFQGKNDMLPTALSEVSEQLVKVALGLIFAYLFRESVQKAVTFLLFAVSLSELSALILMLILYKREKGRQAQEKSKNEEGRVETKSILRLSIPVTLNSALLPLSGLLDSVLSVRLLSAYAPDPVALYGLFSGGAVTVINLPVSVCYGIAAASIPAVATAAATGANVKKRVFYALLITVAVALPAALGLYLFAEPATRIIFRSLKNEELATLTALIKTFSLSALTLSCVQTLSACLTAQGKPLHSAISMLVGITVKTVVYAFLLRDPQISVFGLAHATNICYLVAFFLDLLYNVIIWRRRKREKGAQEYDYGNRIGRRKGRSY